MHSRRTFERRDRARLRGAALLVAGLSCLLVAAEPSADAGDAGTAAPTRRAARPLVLVTQAEIAALPSDVPVSALVEPDEATGPIIQIESPENLGTYRGPFPIRVEFLAGPLGLPVDMDTLKLEYRKAWGIDITSRVRDYVEGTTIDVAESELPRGRHTVDIAISDTGGNRSVRRFTVTVE